MKKTIYFCIDLISKNELEDSLGSYTRCTCYEDTDDAIEHDASTILTTSIAHLSFGVINKGYEIYLCYQDKKVKIEEGMELSESGYCLSEPSCCEDADILDCFRTGYFDEILGIKRKD